MLSTCFIINRSSWKIVVSAFNWEVGVSKQLLYMVITGTILYLILSIIELGVVKRCFAVLINHLPWSQVR